MIDVKSLKKLFTYRGSFVPFAVEIVTHEVDPICVLEQTWKIEPSQIPVAVSKFNLVERIIFITKRTMEP